MTNETYIKATEILQQIKHFEKLKFIASRSTGRYKRFHFGDSLFMSSYDRKQVCLCDDGLTEVILEYCEKRIKELKEELESL